MQSVVNIQSNKLDDTSAVEYIFMGNKFISSISKLIWYTVTPLKMRRDGGFSYSET